MGNKWKFLSSKLKKEVALLGNRTEAKMLLEVWEAGRAEDVERDGEIIAFGALWPVSSKSSKQWFELGTLWVAKEFRSRKLISGLFAALIKKVSDNDRVFLVTHNLKVAYLALKYGMHEESVATWFADVPSEASCGPCDRVSGDKTHCPFRAVENQCRLFVL